MADGASFALNGGSTGRVLMGVKPTPGETWLSFTVRTLARNHLGAPVSFMRRLGVNLEVKGDYLRRLNESPTDLASLFGLTAEQASNLWGARAPEAVDGSRRLGSVMLRPSLIDQTRRWAPPSLDRNAGDRAIWLLEPISFCPISWEVLVTTCPERGCGRKLTWPRATSLHRCRHCGASIRGHKSRYVPKKHRAPLKWFTDLLSEDPVTADAAMKIVPAYFGELDHTGVFELVLAFRHASLLMRSQASGGDYGDEETPWLDLVNAAKFLLEFPRSEWDLIQAKRQQFVPPIYGVLARIERDTLVPVVRREFGRLLNAQQRVCARLPMTGRVNGSTFGTLSAARALSTMPGKVVELAEAGHLPVLRVSGSQRKHLVFDAEVLRDFKLRLNACGRWSTFERNTGLPPEAIRQFLALGYLKPCQERDLLAFRAEPLLEGKTSDRLIDRLSRVRFKDEPEGWIDLQTAFMGVGGRAKPWAPVIMDALTGKLPGGLTGNRLDHKTRYYVQTVTARQLIMGSDPHLCRYDFRPSSYGQFAPTDLGSGDVTEYLNCNPADLTWLREAGHLSEVSRARFDIRSVEDFGARWMTTKEAAVRLGVHPKTVWSKLENYDVPSLGRGFRDRAELERVVQLEQADIHQWFQEASE